jgi:hypothetical protein
MGKEDELVAVAECGTNVEASMLRGALDAAGIFCHVQGENHRSLIGVGTFSPLVELRLMVRRRDAGAARALVDDFRAESAKALEEEAAPAGASSLPRAKVESPDRKRARLLAIFPGFGAGHHSVGAHALGMAFTAASAYAFYALVTGQAALAVCVYVTSTIADFVTVGAVADQRAAREPNE